MLLWGEAVAVLTFRLFSACQTVTSARPPTDPMQPCSRPPPTSCTSSVAPGSISGPGPSPARASPVSRPSSAANKSLSPVASRSPGAAVSAPSKPQSPAQSAAAPQDGSQDKLAEQMALVRGWRLPACDTQLLSSQDTAAGSCSPSSERRWCALRSGGTVDTSRGPCAGGRKVLCSLSCAEGSSLCCCCHRLWGRCQEVACVTVWGPCLGPLFR